MAVEGVDAMRTLPESDGPMGRPDYGPARRLVAVAVTAADVLHPASDLRNVAGAGNEVDVLVARVDEPVPARLPLPLDALDYPDPRVPADGPGPVGAAGAVGGVDDVLDGFTVPLPPGAVAREPDLPAGLFLHRLDLRWRVQDADEPDLVAALSELIGFDPEGEVFCVAPATAPDGAADPEEAAIGRAVARVARVYGLPVLHYRRIPDGAGTRLASAARPEHAV